MAFSLTELHDIVRYKDIVKDPYQAINTLIVEITTKCNARCPFCYINNIYEKSQIMNFNAYKILIKKILKIFPNLNTIVLSGGEPLLHPSIYDFVSLTEDYGLNIALLTNGLLLRKYIQLFERYKIDLDISLHGPPSIHDNMLKVPNSYRIVLKNIKFISNFNVNIHLSSNVTDKHLESFPHYPKELLDLIINEDINIKVLNLQRILKTKKLKREVYLKYYNLNIHNYIKILKNIDKLSNTYKKINIRVIDPLNPCFLIRYLSLNNSLIRLIYKYTINCACGRGVLTVGVDGNIRLCPIFNLILGNIFENKLDFSIIKKIELIEKKYCSNCPFYRECNILCPINLLETYNNLKLE